MVAATDYNTDPSDIIFQSKFLKSSTGWFGGASYFSARIRNSKSAPALICVVVRIVAIFFGVEHLSGAVFVSTMSASLINVFDYLNRTNCSVHALVNTASILNQ